MASVLFTEIAFLGLSVSSKFPTALLTHSIPQGSVCGHLTVLFIIYTYFPAVFIYAILPPDLGSFNILILLVLISLTLFVTIQSFHDFQILAPLMQLSL